MNTKQIRQIGLLLFFFCAFVWFAGWQKAQAAPDAPGDPVVNTFLISSDSDDTNENNNAGGHCALEDATIATTLNTFSLTSDSNDTNEANNVSGVCIADTPAAANVDLDVTTNTVGPVRQGDPISFTVTITNVDAAPLTTLPVDVVFPDAYLDCTSASQTPTNVVDNQMTWADLLGTAAVTLNQNQAISFLVNCTAGLDTTLLPNQEAELMGMAANAADSDGIGIFAPTSVMMVERSVEYDTSTGRSTLRWQTSDESQMVGFHVYRRIEPTALQSRFVQASRSSDKADEWIRLTDQPLVATSTGRSSGEIYEYVDQLDASQTSALQRSNRQPHYKLGVLTVDGEEYYLDLGQASEENRDAGDREQLYVPLMMQ
ncbi:MAG: hypothetical protein AAF702_37970 [Chloroflexota bacterium]